MPLESASIRRKSAYFCGELRSPELSMSSTKARIRVRQASYRGSRILSAAKRNAPEPHVGSRTLIPGSKCSLDFSGTRPARWCRRLGEAQGPRIRDHVLGKLADVEVVGDQVVDLVNFAGSELFPNLKTASRRATCSRHVSVGSANPCRPGCSSHRAGRHPRGPCQCPGEGV